MRTSISAAAIFFLLLFSSCQFTDARLPADSRTAALSSYLKVNFGDSIPSQKHTFVLVSDKDSRQNVAAILHELRPELQARKRETYSFILSADMPVADSLLPSGVRTDWDGALDRLKLVTAGVVLVQTEGGRISTIKPLTAESSAYVLQ